MIIYDKTILKREGKYVDFSENLLADLAEYLNPNDINKLYCHQAEMFEKTLEKNNIVITTSTASGKH